MGALVLTFAGAVVGAVDQLSAKPVLAGLLKKCKRTKRQIHAMKTTLSTLVSRLCTRAYRRENDADLAYGCVLVTRSMFDWVRARMSLKEDSQLFECIPLMPAIGRRLWLPRCNCALPFEIFAVGAFVCVCAAELIIING